MNKFIKSISLIITFIITLSVISSCNKKTQISPTSSTSEEVSKNYDDVILTDEEENQNREFVNIFNKSYNGYDKDNNIQNVYNNITENGLCLRKADDTIKISNSEKMIEFYNNILNKVESQIVVYTAETETFQGDYLFYTPANGISLIEKTIRTKAINDTEDIKIKRTSTHTESIDFCSINKTGFIEFIHDVEDENIFTSFSYKIFNYEERVSFINDFNTKYMKKAQGLWQKSFASPEEIEPNQFLFFIEDLYLSNNKLLTDEYKNFNTPLGNGVEIPFNDVKKAVEDNFNFQNINKIDELLKQSTFFDSKKTFNYTFGRGGGGSIGQIEKISLYKNGDMLVITNFYDTEKGEFIDSSKMMFNTIDGVYKIYSNQMSNN